MLYSKVNLYFIVCLYFYYTYSEKYNCNAGFSMTLTLTLVCPLTYYNTHNVMFIKLVTNNVYMTMSWRYCFLHYDVFCYLCLPHEMGRHIVFSSVVCPSVCPSVRHTFVSALYLLNPWWDFLITLHKCQV